MQVKRIALLGLVLGLGACDENHPFAGGTPVGERCGTGPVEDFAGRAACKKGDTIETLKPAVYCDFDHPVVSMSGGALGFSGSVATCVYVGELRKGRAISEEDAKTLISDSARATAEAQARTAAAAQVRAEATVEAQARAAAEAQVRAEAAVKAKAALEALAKAARQKAVENISDGIVEIPGGTFQMGCSPGDTECNSDETPAHKVTVSAFRIGKYEVTQAQWQAVMGENPARFKSDDRPVEGVSWNDVQEFLKRLNAVGAAKPYRLPTEAEWEYAARAGTRTPYWWGKEIGTGNANCSGCGSRWDNRETAPVGSFTPNPFGLYDTAGNVWEWVQDCYHADYTDAPPDGSEWPDSCPSAGRVLRGGSWIDDARNVRVSSRGRNTPGNRNAGLGLRPAQDL